MSVFAELHDGRRLEFPDGTDPAVIQRTVKRVLGGQAQQPAQPDAADEYGPFQAALVGMGRTGDRLYKGAKDLALTIPAELGHAGAQAERQRMAAEEAENTRLYAKLQEKQPAATFLGEAAPLVAAPMLGGGSILGMAAGASLPGLIEYGTPEERLWRGAGGAAGGAVGATAGKVLGHLVKPVQTPITQSRGAAIAAADRLGVPLRASEKTGSRALGWGEAALNDLPFSGGMAQKVELARQKAINRAAARAMGQDADELTEGVFAAARQKASNTYNALIGNRQIPLDRTFQNEVQAISGSKVMKALRDESVDNLIEPFRNLPGPVRVTGEWFQQNKTALDAAINSAYTAGQSGKARALEQFESALERAAARSMTPAEREAFKTVQKQWASLRLLEKGAVVENGNVLPGRLNQAMRARYKDAFKEGKIKGDLADVARIGEAFKSLPQSGTTPRAFYSGLAGGALFADPLTSAGIMAGPPAAQAALQSPLVQRYLTQGITNVSPETQRLLMLLGAGGGAVGGGLLGAQ